MRLQHLFKLIVISSGSFLEDVQAPAMTQLVAYTTVQWLVREDRVKLVKPLEIL